MNKKLVLSILVVIILVGAGAFIFLTPKGEGSGDAGFARFFGFGNPDTSGTQGSPTTDLPGDETTPSDDTLAALPGVRKLHDAPVAGFSLFSRGSDTIVRYQERSRGYVYELPLLNGSAMRLSSTTFSTVYESFFGKAGQATYARTLTDQDAIKTTLFTVSRDVSYTLANNIESLVVSPDTQKAFYLVRTADGATGYTVSFDTAAPKKIFSSSAAEWLASWTNPASILLATKPSAHAPGSLSLLNTKTLGVSRAVSNVPGVTGVLSPNGTTILYSKSIDGGIETYAHSLASGVSQKAPFTTLPEKCVWSTKEVGVVYCAIPRSIPRGDYPDQWYQGTISFFDEIWKFDVASGSPYGQVVVSTNMPEPVDAVSLALSPDESFLVFINKRDGALWGVSLDQEAPDIQ